MHWPLSITTTFPQHAGKTTRPDMAFQLKYPSNMNEMVDEVNRYCRLAVISMTCRHKETEILFITSRGQCRQDTVIRYPSLFSAALTQFQEFDFQFSQRH